MWLYLDTNAISRNSSSISQAGKGLGKDCCSYNESMVCYIGTNFHLYIIRTVNAESHALQLSSVQMDFPQAHRQSTCMDT